MRVVFHVRRRPLRTGSGRRFTDSLRWLRVGDAMSPVRNAMVGSLVDVEGVAARRAVRKPYSVCQRRNVATASAAGVMRFGSS
jgi:hypothetical protein